ncbi:serine/threonine protein kinase [Piscinibacter sp. XHJ-5]|uniref:serine/threonine protein kinase n=1 Tax=Piscinibacter sp. XHJ-5 TaxID=3037797 RepID=UPI002452DCC9|nr:serine/threonine protein kinase [Piscinibacter sp. XHJ-5]
MTAPHPASLTPYAGLTPGFVLDALDSVGLRGDGRLLQLNSYENRVFQVFLEDGQVVVAKFYRPGRWSNAQILEEHRFTAELAAEEIPAVAPLVMAADATSQLKPTLHGDPPTLACIEHEGEEHRFTVAPRRSGREPPLEGTSELAWIGRFIGRMHAVGARRLFEHRVTLGVDAIGRAARDWICEHGDLPPELLPPWQDAADRALDIARKAFDRLGDAATIRVHGDCHIGNVLWTDHGPHFVDLDDAMNGPAVQDLWMLLSADGAEGRAQVRALLGGYESFREFDDRELALVEPLRTLRMIHHSAWIAKRWKDPAFPAAFPWFGTTSYWQEQVQLLRERIE